MSIKQQAVEITPQFGAAELRTGHATFTLTAGFTGNGKIVEFHQILKV